MGVFMNFRKLITYLTMGTAAAMPLAVAQNPTILQGSYISNVFGNSNFIKNPNAQTNIADVTVSSATVTRSTTTPLVATSEFNITTSTATGSATWSTRTFDAGMKGQNCEARFSYRGFSVGSTTAQILQGANVVAQLTLTPSTDPRIASINFPCGDLSSATTFRLQQATASLTGTNEIGGIYVGLATNMANVAQAENVVQVNRSTAQSFTSGVAAIMIYTTEIKDVYGEYDTSTGIFTAKRAGDYLITSSILTENVAWTAGNYSVIYIQKNGNNACVQFQKVQAAITTNLPNVATCTITLAVGDTLRTLYEQARGGVTNSHTDGTYVYSQIYRFPSSSELVVTPERQNVFAGIRASSGVVTNLVNTNGVWTKLTSGGTLTRVNFGRAKVETNNDYSLTVENMPVGSYAITVTGAFHAEASSAGNVTACIFGVSDSVGGTMIAAAQQAGNGDSSLPTQANLANSFTGIYTNSSVANRTFTVQAYRIVGGGNCYGYAENNRPLTITIQPLDQPTNSALYVQGPVLGAQTGAAIPAGYLGQTQLCSGSRGFVNNTNGAAGWSLNSSVSAGCTLTPGIYLVRWSFYLAATSGTSTGQKTAVLTTDSTDGWSPTSNLSQGNLAFGNGTLSGDDQRATTSIVTVTPSGISGGTGFVLYGKILVTSHTSFTGTYYFDAAIVRLN